MADWIETFRGAVMASEYDSDAHMNSVLYVSRFDQATWFLLGLVDITPQQMKAQNQRLAIVRQTYQFLRELRGGDMVLVRSGFVGVGAKHLRLLHRMYDGTGETMVATCDCTAVEAGLKTGKAAALPAALRARVEAMLVTANVTDPQAE